MMGSQEESEISNKSGAFQKGLHLVFWHAGVVKSFGNRLCNYRSITDLSDLPITKKDSLTLWHTVPRLAISGKPAP